jgi:hypothetical protein
LRRRGHRNREHPCNQPGFGTHGFPFLLCAYTRNRVLFYKPRATVGVKAAEDVP